MRESYSDPRSLFGRAHRSTSQSEQQRYILSEEDVRGLDDRKQFLFVNHQAILADKIRYYEEPFFKARTATTSTACRRSMSSGPEPRTCRGPRASIGGASGPSAHRLSLRRRPVPTPRYSGAEGLQRPQARLGRCVGCDYLTMALSWLYGPMTTMAAFDPSVCVSAP